MSEKITSFSGEHAFLSNFYPSPIRINNEYYLTGEHAFQAAKTDNKMERDEIAAADTPGKAKKMGRKVTLRPNWEETKYAKMRAIVEAKFTQNPDLAQKLIDTGDAELIEGNNWGDRTWGTVDGAGKNWLGEILMLVRDKLKDSRDQTNVGDGS